MPLFRACALALLLLAGCRSLPPGITEPQAEITALRLSKLSFDAVVVTLEVELANPHKVALPLDDLRYELRSGPSPIVRGSVPLEGTIPARSVRSLKVPVEASFLDVLGAVTTATPGGVLPYAADIVVSGSGPDTEALELPATRDGEIPVPVLPEVSVKAVEMGEPTLFGTQGRVTLQVVNRNAFPIDLSKLAYTLSLGGVSVATGRLARATRFEPGVSKELTFDFGMSLLNMGRAAYGVAGSASGAGAGEYGLDAEIAMKTPWGNLSRGITRDAAGSKVR